MCAVRTNRFKEIFLKYFAPGQWCQAVPEIKHSAGRIWVFGNSSEETVAFWQANSLSTLLFELAGSMLQWVQGS